MKKLYLLKGHLKGTQGVVIYWLNTQNHVFFCINKHLSFLTFLIANNYHSSKGKLDVLPFNTTLKRIHL